jgi:hypothetical protein
VLVGKAELRGGCSGGEHVTQAMRLRMKSGCGPVRETGPDHLYANLPAPRLRGGQVVTYFETVETGLSSVRE